MDELPPKLIQNCSIVNIVQQDVNKDVQELAFFWENFLNATDENFKVNI